MNVRYASPLIALALVIASDVLTQPQATNLDTKSRLAVASRIYALVQEHFAHWEGVSRPSVEEAYRKYVGDSEQVKSRRDFDLATLRFIAKLRNGHTQFADSQMDGPPLKFRLLEVENQWIVLGSQESRLPRGAAILTIDDTPVGDFVRAAATYVAASNDRLARTHVFSSGILFPEQVSLGLRNGDVVVVNRATPGDTPAVAPPTTPEGRWLVDGRLAYIRVPSFANPTNEDAAIELVRQFASAPNLAIDVRRNGGGITPGRLIGALMNRTWRTWRQTAPQPVDSRPQPPVVDAYTGRLFLLVDRFCGSACEDFVMPFKDTGRGVILGETTQGSSGNPYRTDLGNGMGITIGAVRYRFPDGSAFEGIGIAPDIPIERRISDITSGRDAVMERARELAAGQ